MSDFSAISNFCIHVLMVLSYCFVGTAKEMVNSLHFLGFHKIYFYQHVNNYPPYLLYDYNVGVVTIRIFFKGI